MGATAVVSVGSEGGWQNEMDGITLGSGDGWVKIDEKRAGKGPEYQLTYGGGEVDGGAVKPRQKLPTKYKYYSIVLPHPSPQLINTENT